jgi:hypothetical protein
MIPTKKREGSAYDQVPKLEKEIEVLAQELKKFGVQLGEARLLLSIVLFRDRQGYPTTLEFLKRTEKFLEETS